MSRTEEKSRIEKHRRDEVRKGGSMMLYGSVVASGLEIGYLDYPLASPGISRDAAELG